MNRNAKIIRNTVGRKEYAKLKESGFRPENMTPAETVLCLQKLQTEEPAAPDGYKEIFTEEAVCEIEEFLALAAELESVSDGACETILRNAVLPTAENLHKLRFEHESIKESARNRDENALAWAFPEERKETAEEFLERIGAEADSMKLAEAQWLIEKEIFKSSQNLQILHELWSLSLPMTEEEALEFAVRQIQSGRNPKEGFLSEGLFELFEREKEAEEESFEEEAGEFLAMLEDGLSEEELYKDYLECIKQSEKYEEFLSKYQLPLTADNIYATGEILEKDRSTFYELLGKLIGKRRMFRIVRKEGFASFEEGAVAELLDALTESYKGREIKEYKDAARVLKLLQKLRTKGYAERPFLFGKEIFTVRLHQAENGFAAVTSGASFGGILLKYRRSEGAANVLAVFEKEETGDVLKDSGLLEKIISSLGDEAFEIHTLLQEGYEYSKNF